MKEAHTQPPERPASFSRWVKWLRVGLVYLLIFVVASFAGNLWLSRNQVSGVAPVIQGQNLQSQWTTVDHKDSEGPVLVYFFADWCPICKVQHDAIRSVNRYYPVLAVAMQSGDTDNVRQYVETAGLDMPVINDVNGSISRDYGVNGVPASFVIDRHGNIRFSTRGYATQLGLLSRLWLSKQDIF